MTPSIAKNLDAAKSGDLDALAHLDDCGLLMGPGETAETYTARIETLLANIGELEKDLQKNGKAEVCGIPLVADEAIPKPVYDEAAPVTRNLYGFATDWVPGFFTSYKMGVLFAGCAWYSLEDFFAVFIVRSGFRNSEKWLIYSRTELLAHELCHIARIAYNSHTYEELFAYQTSTSGFRRIIGGLLRSPLDTYVLLGSVGILFCAQVINVLVRPPEVWQDFPMPLIWGGLLAAFAFIGGRYAAAMNRFKRLKSHLADLTARESVLPVLFRCTDEELDTLSTCCDSADLHASLQQKISNELRWQITAHRFLPDMINLLTDSPSSDNP